MREAGERIREDDERIHEDDAGLREDDERAATALWSTAA
jgi:hypothetical protein